MKNDKPMNRKAEAEKIFKQLVKKQPTVEDVRAITYLVNQMARQNARIGA